MLPINKEYPSWVCSSCGAKYGRRRCGLASWHVGTCGICGAEASVTEPRDFGHLCHDWLERVGADIGIDEREKRLMAGNTALLEALMDMVNQFFYSKNSSGQPDEDGDFLYHSFMSAEEGAIAILIEAGMAEEVQGKGYRLRWDRLEERKKNHCS